MSWELIISLVGLVTTVVLTVLGWLIKAMRENSADQARGFREAGQWRSEVDKELAVLKERTARIERIPTGTSPGYRRPK